MLKCVSPMICGYTRYKIIVISESNENKRKINSVY